MNEQINRKVESILAQYEFKYDGLNKKELTKGTAVDNKPTEDDKFKEIFKNSANKILNR